MLVANVIGFQGILNYKLTDKGAGLEGNESSRSCRRSEGRPQLPPQRTSRSGRTGRSTSPTGRTRSSGTCSTTCATRTATTRTAASTAITYGAARCEKAAPIAGQSVPQLLDLLKSPENRVPLPREDRAELPHDAKEVIPAVEKWIAGLDKNDTELRPPADRGPLDVLVEQRGERAAAQAGAAPRRNRCPGRGHAVLCYWHDRIPTALDMLKKLVADDSPRVRLEAVRACSFSRTPRRWRCAAIP